MSTFWLSQKWNTYFQHFNIFRIRVLVSGQEVGTWTSGANDAHKPNVGCSAHSFHYWILAFRFSPVPPSRRCPAKGIFFYFSSLEVLRTSGTCPEFWQSGSLNSSTTCPPAAAGSWWRSWGSSLCWAALWVCCSPRESEWLRAVGTRSGNVRFGPILPMDFVSIPGELDSPTVPALITPLFCTAAVSLMPQGNVRNVVRVP